MKCKSCGAEINEGAKFCTNCGAEVVADVAAAPAVEIPMTPEDAPKPQYERVDAEVVGNANAGNAGPMPNPEGSTDYSGNPNINTVMQAAGVQKDPNAGPIAFSIASMVCGILSILCCCCKWFAILCAIAAIVLGIIALNKKCEGKGMAIAGIVCGGVGAVICLTLLVIGKAASDVGAASGFSDLFDFDMDSIEDFIDGL